MEAGDTSGQHLNALDLGKCLRQANFRISATANIQELARQSAADRREMQELTKQNQELIALLRSRGETQIPIPGQNGGEGPRNEEGGNQNQGQNDEGSSANQNRQPRPSQVIEPTKSAADVKAARLEEELKEMKEQMKEMKSQVKAKAARNLDILVHRSESPFTKRVDDYPLSNKVQGGRRSARPANYLLNIQQREGESLRSYVQRFNKEAVQIDEPNEFVALTAFNAGLQKGDFLFQFCKDPPRSMSELMYEVQKFINAEDAFEARDKLPSKKRKEPEERRFESPKNIVSKPDFSEVDRKNVGSSSGQGPTWEGPYRVVKFHRRGTYHLEKLDETALPHPWNAEHLKKYYQ
uniref:Retrotransposon gag domain-containing protein n=1 Tax=Fagus sylvatica TaxID=28930 RepID=A0A2N9HG94_FAGSY